MKFFPPFPFGRLARIERKLDIALARLGLQAKLEKHEMAALDDLEAKVASEETVEQSAITLLETLKAELDEALATGDTARIQALSDKIGADTDALAAAVSANTPAQQPPAG